MPCYGGSCCDFCGLEIGVAHFRKYDENRKPQYTLNLKDSIFLSWLNTEEILTEKGKVCDRLSNDTIYVMMDANDKYKRYTNMKLDWVDNKDFFEGVFLHAFCRMFVEKKTRWTRKQIYSILRQKREPYAVSDRQVNFFVGMEWSKVPMWRAINPHYNDENREWFQNRLKQLMSTAENDLGISVCT